MTKIRTAAGYDLSEEDIEALADEAERGYDLDKAIRVTVGRPSLGAEGVSPRIQVRVDSTLATALRARAARSAPSAILPVLRYASTSTTRLERPPAPPQPTRWYDTSLEVP